jgi:raffinose/stachyose/melibiose transport system substrate-binding protein
VNADRSNGDVATTEISRRSVLRWGVLGVGLLASGGLAACSSSKSSGAAAATTSAPAAASGAATSSAAAATTSAPAAASGAATSAAAGTKAVTLKFLTNDSQTDLLKKVFADYQTQNPGVTVAATYAPSANYGPIVNTQLQSGNGPDSLEAAAGASGAGGVAIQALASQGVLADLSDQPWASQLPAPFDPICQYQGKTYGLFTTAGAIPTFYNVAAFKSVDAEAPTTWSELLALCEKLKAKGVPAFSQGLKDGWPSILIPYALTSTLVYGPTPDWETQHKAGKVKFAGSGWETAFEMYKELSDKGYLSKASTSNTFAQMNSDVAVGKAAMCVPVSQGLPTILTTAKPGEINSFALPATEDATKTSVPFGLAFGVCLNAKSKHPDEVKKLINFLAQPAQVSALTSAGGNLPVLVTADTKMEPELQAMLPYILAQKTSAYPDPQWPSQKVQDAQIKETQLLLAGAASAKDVVNAMDQAYEAGA